MSVGRITLGRLWRVQPYRLLSRRQLFRSSYHSAAGATCRTGAIADVVFHWLFRFASDFAQDQIKNINNRTSQLRMIRSLVDSAVDIMLDPKARCASSATVAPVMAAQARAGRQRLQSATRRDLRSRPRRRRDRRQAAGAGGGGFMVFLVEPEKRAQVRERLNKLIHVNVGFDTEGSKIIIYQPDEI